MHPFPRNQSSRKKPKEMFNGQAGLSRPLSVTSFRSRDFVLESVFVLEVMADHQSYCFEPQCVANSEDSESEVRRHSLVYSL